MVPRGTRSRVLVAGAPACIGHLGEGLVDSEASRLLSLSLVAAISALVTSLSG